MTWVRFDDQASIHRKVAPLDDATYRLWREAIEWCSRNTTDGRIAAKELAGTSKRASKARARVLVDQGLWHDAGHHCDSPKCPPSGVDGWLIHDYLDYQPSKEQVTAEREAKAERTRRWRDRKTGGPSRDASPDPSQDAPVMLPRPAPSRPAPKEAGAGPPERHPATPCPTCGNPTDSPYHQRVCRADLPALANGTP